MTVCIAAIWENRGVIVAADKQITQSDTNFKYESGQPKIFVLSQHILALVADDMALQGELMIETRKSILARKSKRPLRVSEAKQMYCAAYDDLHKSHAERSILVPQGLTFKTFYAQQKSGELNETATTLLVEQLADYRMPFGVQTIIAGTDDLGAGIYVINNDEVRCETIRGYAAIGAGAEPAESQFRYAKYVRHWESSDTCFLAYVAKKRAQVIEGVGDETNVIVIFPDRGYENVSEKGYKILEKEYSRLEKQIQSNEQKARNRVRNAAESEGVKATGIGSTATW